MSYCSDLLVVILSFVVLICIKKVTNGDPRPIYNIYQQKPNFYWLKVFFIYTILQLRKFKTASKRRKLGVVEKEKEWGKLEQPQKLSSHQNAIDAVYFNAANSSGDHLLVGTARRKNGLVDGFVYLKIEESGLGLLESPKLPGTSLYKEEDTEKYEVEGIVVTPLEPMKKWRICYEGKMKRFEDRNVVVDVKIDALWSSSLPHFNFDVDIDPLLMAKAMAREKWSKEYFRTLEEIHQTHYEQYGDITGNAEIDGRSYSLNLNSLRDHSFGTMREWRFFHRYGLHFISTEAGDRMTVGSICMPVAFSRLIVGYIYVARDGKIYPVQGCDLELYQHGENGDPPKDYAFTFWANNESYTVQVNVVDSPEFFLSKDWESRIVERLCKFEVNGIRGWGAAEWQYRNIDGKNRS